jgi:hypothetical protein
VVLKSELPMGAGLGSSAAFCVCIAAGSTSFSLPFFSFPLFSSLFLSFFLCAFFHSFLCAGLGLSAAFCVLLQVLPSILCFFFLPLHSSSFFLFVLPRALPLRSSSFFFLLSSFFFLLSSFFFPPFYLLFPVLSSRLPSFLFSSFLFLPFL